MICRTCKYDTDRLTVREWHSLSPDEWQERDLAHVVTAILTEPVTQSLPAEWQGAYSDARAHEWIEERDAEGTTLLIIEKATHMAVGMLILYETDAESVGGVEVRLGYLLAETAWGRAFAGEAVSGFVDWCRGQGGITSLAGGVEADNAASKRVLEKNGFRPVTIDHPSSQDSLVYRLQLR